MPPHKLSLKIHQPIMLLRNANQAEGLCNGTRLIIKELHKHYLKVQMTMGKNKDKVFFNLENDHYTYRY
jgi:ATP-dependent DNA helicase PIF1